MKFLDNEYKVETKSKAITIPNNTAVDVLLWIGNPSLINADDISYDLSDEQDYRDLPFVIYWHADDYRFEGVNPTIAIDSNIIPNMGQGLTVYSSSIGEIIYEQIPEEFIPDTIATKEYVDKETVGVQNHLVDNDLHVILGERAKWNTAYDHSQNTNMHNAYSSFSFRNAISTYATTGPEDPTDPTPTEFNVSAQTSNHPLKFIATNNLIEFNSSDMRDSDEVEITIHADPEGSAQAALKEANENLNTHKNEFGLHVSE